MCCVMRWNLLWVGQTCRLLPELELLAILCNSLACRAHKEACERDRHHFFITGLRRDRYKISPYFLAYLSCKVANHGATKSVDSPQPGMILFRLATLTAPDCSASWA